MSNSPKEQQQGWIDDFPDIPEAGLLWPWVMGGVALALLGMFLVLTPAPTNLPVPLQTLIPAPALASPSPGQISSTIRLAFVDSAKSSFGKAGEDFAHKIDELSGGRLHVQVFPGGMVEGTKLDERTTIEQIQKGQLQMGFITSSPLSGYNNAFEVLDLPFLFRDHAHADRVLKGVVGQEMLAGLEANGLVGLGYLELGFRLFSSSVPLRTLKDFQGKKLRVMQSTQALLFAKALNAEGVATPVDKILTAAREGFIDAADRTYPTYWDFKLYEVHRYITDSRHTYSVKVILVNKAFYDSLPPADQKILKEATQFIETEQAKIQRDDDARVKALCRQQNIQIFELDERERQRWVDACSNLYLEYTKLRGGDLLDKVKAAGR